MNAICLKISPPNAIINPLLSSSDSLRSVTQDQFSRFFAKLRSVDVYLMPLSENSCSIPLLSVFLLHSDLPNFHYNGPLKSAESMLKILGVSHLKFCTLSHSFAKQNPTTSESSYSLALQKQFSVLVIFHHYNQVHEQRLVFVCTV